MFFLFLGEKAIPCSQRVVNEQINDLSNQFFLCEDENDYVNLHKANK